MNDIEKLVVSLVGIVVFYMVMRFIRKQSIGKAHESSTRRNITVISIIYGIGMTIQIISIVSRILGWDS